MREKESACDVAVLGAGPGGYAAALRAAQRGAKVCCIEKGHVGGTCLNVGCIPVKALLQAGRLAWEIGRAGQFGISTSPLSVNGPTCMSRVASVVRNLRKGVLGLLKARGVELIAGCGKLDGPAALRVETADGMRRIRAGSIIIATGSRPMRPAFLPWASPNILTTDEATTAADLPESVIVLGGGVIGCEFATACAELGVETTVVEMLETLLPPLDGEAGKAVARSLKARGVRIRTGAKVVGVRAGADGVSAELEGGETLQAAVLLAAVGRAPNVEGIGLETIGIELSDGVISVDERCRTAVEGVYAVGDVAERRQYAHLATRMGLVAADNACGHASSDDRRVVPECVYTHPEVATIRLPDAPADTRTARFPYLASGRAHAAGRTEGMVKLAAEQNGRIAGATVIGACATEVIHEIVLAMRHGLTVSQVAETIHAHPTFAEAVGESADAWLGLPLHTLR